MRSDSPVRVCRKPCPVDLCSLCSDIASASGQDCFPGPRYFYRLHSVPPAGPE
ncbi:uncharacterized protein LY79DRAFT_565378 [Colletotrichum navitas]|uniref:Uncharacterized protein n=1 Tax=Colletotrichum navitas TaxID=681940 RepID=A0AAD8PS28_9PEZI|nr:uncharacterized protein LY79DRAFT_565378 [Colletotrichum navitas]KAK1574654.1 hypothetical protein LY79DRAFT_565378 [Colletotrichum navitas]